MDKPATIDQYLAALPDDQRAALTRVRQAVQALSPTATESISYGMPTFKYQGRHLIYFAAAKNHCALYGTSQGTIHFPPAKPPTKTLLRQLLRQRMTDIEAAKKRR